MERHPNASDWLARTGTVRAGLSFLAGGWGEIR